MRLRQNLRHRDGRRGCRKADRLACAQDGGLDPDPQAPRMGHGVAGYFLKEEGNGSGAGKQVVSVGPRSAGGPRDRPAQLPAKAICLNAPYPEPSLPSGIRCMPPPPLTRRFGPGGAGPSSVFCAIRSAMLPMVLRTDFCTGVETLSAGSAGVSGESPAPVRSARQVTGDGTVRRCKAVAQLHAVFLAAGDKARKPARLSPTSPPAPAGKGPGS